MPLESMALLTGGRLNFGSARALRQGVAAAAFVSNLALTPCPFPRGRGELA